MTGQAPTLVIDDGSGTCKTGYAGDNAPRDVFPTIVGRRKAEVAMMGSSEGDLFFGDEAQAKRSFSNICYPIEQGIVRNWDDMEKFWHYTFFNRLRVAPKDHSVVLTEAPLNPKVNREKMTQIMCETFLVPRFYVGIGAVLSLYATSRTTGIVCESGDGVTHVVPVCEGYSLPHAVRKMLLAGHNLTEWMAKLLVQREVACPFTFSPDLEVVRDIKETCAYVALDYEAELSTVASSSRSRIEQRYELPDGSLITLGAERFRCPEVLFRPSLAGLDGDGVPQAIYNSIGRCNMDVHRELMNNIVLSGGCTMFEGLERRIQKEVQALASPSGAQALAAPSSHVRVVASNERKYGAWIGGSMLASLSTFGEMFITQAEYEEWGPAIVHRKCF